MVLDPGLYAPCLLHGRDNWDGQGQSRSTHHYRLINVVEGRHRLYIDERKGYAGPGSIYLVPPMAPCEITAHTSSRARFLSFLVKASATESASRGQARMLADPQPQPGPEEVWECTFPLVFDADLAGAVADDMAFINVTWWLDAVHYRQAMVALVSLLHRIVSHHLPAAPQPEAMVTGDLIADVLDLVGLQLKRLRSSRDIADFVGVTPDHLNRTFKAATGETASAYLKRMRLIEACHLLRTTDESIESVALMVGYRNGSVMGRAWQRAYGTSPMRWRRA